MIAVRRSSLLATVLATAVSVSAIPGNAAASDELARAKDLYRSAAYDEALSTLDQIASETAGPTRVEASEYRIFCLIALDRRAEARVVIESMVNSDPFYQLSADQAAPRVRTMFKEIRQSLLPGLVQREYASAKTAFDRQEPDAAAQFDRVLKLLDDPLVAPSPALADLRTVASGFRDLSRARVPKPEASPAAPVVAQMQAGPVVAMPPAVQNPAPAASERKPANAAAKATASGPIVYRDGDPDVVPPVPIRQTLPQWVVPQGTRPGAWQPEGVIEVTIDESGDVVNVALRKAFHPSYDPQIVKAAMAWKYEPARKGGVPVRYVRMIAVRLGDGN
jgi:hypothetical protein